MTLSALVQYEITLNSLPISIPFPGRFFFATLIYSLVHRPSTSTQLMKPELQQKPDTEQWTIHHTHTQQTSLQFPFIVSVGNIVTCYEIQMGCLSINSLFNFNK